ncbi:SCO family protein [Massilia sp. TW-1]|uniref:SCO family protein n=1 Tax=Telluria antibiotica TaxID=2717319 RepID=A0ABX0P9L9_9BURK|nr:SCO family protein [Telluria antibiotica]NIA52885.1 SCO family protein [Telluria antibiotica]
MNAVVILLLAVVLGCSPAAAQALRLPSPPPARFEPVPGTRLPLDAILRDDEGREVKLASLFDRPIVLVPGYYTCPNLCSTLFEGVLQALALSGLAAGDYRLVGLSVDPRDGAAAAATRKRAYAALLPGGAADLTLLTGDAATLAQLEAALGYRAVPDAASGQLAHAAGFVVLAPDGRIAHAFSGVRFDPAGLRAAVKAAGHDAPAPSFGQLVLLLCAHYAPTSGRHTGAALAGVRAGVLLLPLLFLCWLWRRRGGRT